MPFGGLGGLKDKVLSKTGKEEVKNTMGDSLGKLQRCAAFIEMWDKDA